MKSVDNTYNSEALGKGARRALGPLISKIHNLEDFGYKSFEKLFYAYVAPFMDYCSSIWGFKK